MLTQKRLNPDDVKNSCRAGTYFDRLLLSTHNYSDDSQEMQTRPEQTRSLAHYFLVLPSRVDI